MRRYLLMRFLFPWIPVYLIFCGCSQKLMPTPAIYREGLRDPFANVHQSDRTPDFNIYYVTDREPSGTSDPETFYSSDRSSSLFAGTANVRIGDEDTSWTELCRLSRQEKRRRNPKVSVTGLREYGVLWEHELPKDPEYPSQFPSEGLQGKAGQKFLTDINQRLGQFDRKNIYVFVHGFNTAFESNLGLAAQLWHYMGKDGVFLIYAWPSKDRLLDYTVDKGNAEYSTRNFRLLLKYLSDNSIADEIHLIGHSAGSPLVVGAITQISLLHYDESPESIRNEWKIGKMVLAAPDMDFEVFVNHILDGSRRIPESSTIYGSTNDRALGLSGKIFEMVRVGSAIKALKPEQLEMMRGSKRYHSVDVTPAEQKYPEFLGHSYFHKNPWVSSDMFTFLKGTTEPEDRGLITPNGALWTFSPDYSERIRDYPMTTVRSEYENPSPISDPPPIPSSGTTTGDWPIREIENEPISNE